MTGPSVPVSITCPACGVVTPGEMPGDSCLYFWDCPTCRAVVKPRAGHCCVFCSYGSVRCATSRDAGRDGH